MESFESQSQEDLFPVQESSDNRQVPLAERMRPQEFDEFVGQEDVLAEDQPLRMAIEQDRVPSLILWGPPGTGKTTLA
ncbi:MAG: replication-associated recombination protein A, partial [Nitrospirota bacterium]|nr:replication-associated recombination protein A [Nitrospirota bacterium]